MMFTRRIFGTIPFYIKDQETPRTTVSNIENDEQMHSNIETDHPEDDEVETETQITVMVGSI